jgi:hypothetical protein
MSGCTDAYMYFNELQLIRTVFGECYNMSGHPGYKGFFFYLIFDV